MSVRYLTFNRQTKTIRDWSRQTGLNAGTITKRLDAGWTVERALTQPLTNRGRKRAQPKPQPQNSALMAYRDSLHKAHRELSSNIRAFVRSIEGQMADLRYVVDNLNPVDHKAIVGAGVVQNFAETPRDRRSSTPQESI